MRPGHPCILMTGVALATIVVGSGHAQQSAPRGAPARPAPRTARPPGIVVPGPGSSGPAIVVVRKNFADYAMVYTYGNPRHYPMPVVPPRALRPPRLIIPAPSPGEGGLLPADPRR